MLEKDTINEIDTSNPLNERTSSENFDEDQDKIQVLIQDLKAEFTSVSQLLTSTSLTLHQKDHFDIIKFTIKVKAVYEYTWEVYRKPSEIKKNFAEISSEISKNGSALSGTKSDIFANVASWPDESIQMHVSEIENYYKTLFQDTEIYNTLAFKEFFNISVGSFNQYNSGSKPFEGYCYKKAEPQCLRKVFSIACKCIEYFAFSQYNLRWIVVKDDCIYYMDKSNSETGKNVYFFDKDFVIKKDGRDIIDIKNVSRGITLKYKTTFERDLWYEEIKKRSDNMLKIISNNPFKSYTNEKKGNSAHWFTDGEDYFKDLSEKLMQAKESIFITDWWLSPEVWLTRPAPTQTYMAMAFQKKDRKESPPYSRLMDILYQCANRGVKVYVLVYAECSLALTLNSAHSQHALQALHPNIQVERHPLNCTDLLWSHHEKLVIIDQIIGYVGGLDLCWGRWDTHAHPIFEEKNDKDEYYFPGIDYSNARIRDFDKVDKYLEESCKRESYEVRMPWHDVHSRLIGPVVADIARHFVERWNFSRFGTGSGITDIKQNASVSKQRNELKETNTLDESLEKKDGNKPAFGFLTGIINQVNQREKEEQEKANSNESDNALMPEEKDENSEEKDENSEDPKQIFGMKMKGKTKLRGRKKKPGEVTISGSSGKGKVDFTKKKGYEEMQALRSRYFKNVEVVDEDHLYVRKGNTTSKLRGRRLNDKIKKIKQAQNRPSKTLTINNDINTNVIPEENEEDAKEEEEEPKKPSYYNIFVKKVGQQAKENESSWFNTFLAKPEQKELETNVVNVNFYIKGVKSNVQVLRSASKWSVGIGKKENSILQGYYQLIYNAKHYLYIENQFFVSR